MNHLKAVRQGLRLSLNATARQAGVSRFRLWSAEQGDITLSVDEAARIRAALRREADHIQSIARALDDADIADSAA